MLPFPETSKLKSEGVLDSLSLLLEGEASGKRPRKFSALIPVQVECRPLPGAIISGGFAQGLRF